VSRLILEILTPDFLKNVCASKRDIKQKPTKFAERVQWRFLTNIQPIQNKFFISGENLTIAPFVAFSYNGGISEDDEEEQRQETKKENKGRD
jgi:hypothetical protein